MEILREGTKGTALATGRGEVSVIYEYRDIELDSGTRVPDVLVGVDEETGEVLTVPPQSTPKIKRARDQTKEETLEARLSRELEDVLGVVADYFEVNESKFTPALIRFYLGEASEQAPLARRLMRLSQRPLAQGRMVKRLRVRCEPRLVDQIRTLTKELDRTTQSDLMRGAILAAKEDVVDRRAKRRSERLSAVASAV